MVNALSPVAEAFGCRLRKAIAAAHASQSQLARELGMKAPSQVNRWCRGESLPEGRYMAQLPELLAVSGHWLLTGQGLMVPDSESQQRSAVLRGVLGATSEQLAECVELFLKADPMPAAVRTDGATVAAPPDLPEGSDDDPTPAEERTREEARKREVLEAALKRTEAELDRLRAQAAATAKSLPHVPLEVVSGGLAEDEARAAGLRLVPDLDVEAAAGTEAYVEQELVVGHLALPEDWLARTCINPEQCRSLRVRGRSMEPTLQAGARILVDPQRTRRLHGHIYVVWTEDGLAVKRLIRDGDDWLLVSDNEDQETYPPVPWPEDAIVRGEVMWTGKMLRGSR